MTKENRERLYTHLRDVENNYEAKPHLNSGPTATNTVRKRAKQSADEILKKHPELEVIKEEKVAEVAPMDESKPIKPKVKK